MSKARKASTNAMSVRPNTFNSMVSLLLTDTDWFFPSPRASMENSWRFFGAPRSSNRSQSAASVPLGERQRAAETADDHPVFTDSMPSMMR